MRNRSLYVILDDIEGAIDSMANKGVSYPTTIELSPLVIRKILYDQGMLQKGGKVTLGSIHYHMGELEVVSNPALREDEFRLSSPFTFTFSNNT